MLVGQLKCGPALMGPISSASDAQLSLGITIKSMELHSLSLWGICGLTSHQQLRLRRNTGGASPAHRFRKNASSPHFVSDIVKSAFRFEMTTEPCRQRARGDVLTVVHGTMSLTQSSHARIPIQDTTIHRLVRDNISPSSESSARLIGLIPNIGGDLALQS